MAIKKRPVKNKEADIEKFGNDADKSTPSADSRPSAPRKHKVVTMPFNLYEWERIEAAREVTGESRQAFIRRAINSLLG